MGGAWARGHPGDYSGGNLVMSWWASHGLKTWVWQRLSAVYMGIYLILFGITYSLNKPYAYVDWHAMFANPVFSIATQGFFLALSIHAWVGVRDVVFDYVKPYPLRLIILAAVIVSLIFMFLWSLRITVLVVD